MLKTGILNLLAQFRHTNTIVIADRGFSFWPQVPTVDISLVDDIPAVRQVLAALLTPCQMGGAWMAAESEQLNPREIWAGYHSLLEPVSITREPHIHTTPCGSIILKSA